MRRLFEADSDVFFLKICYKQSEITPVVSRFDVPPIPATNKLSQLQITNEAASKRTKTVAFVYLEFEHGNFAEDIVPTVKRTRRA